LTPAQDRFYLVIQRSEIGANGLRHLRGRQFGVAIIGIMLQSKGSEFHRNRRGFLIFFSNAAKEDPMASVDGSDKENA